MYVCSSLLGAVLSFASSFRASRLLRLIRVPSSPIQSCARSKDTVRGRGHSISRSMNQSLGLDFDRDQPWESVPPVDRNRPAASVDRGSRRIQQQAFWPMMGDNMTQDARRLRLLKPAGRSCVEGRGPPLVDRSTQEQLDSV